MKDKKGNNKIAAIFFSELFAATTQTHMFHLMTNSYADHMALATFYDGMPDLIDSLAETYQAHYGLIKQYPTNISLTNNYDPIGYLTNLKEFIESNKEKVCTKSNFINQVDMVFDLIDSALYKLKNLTK